MRNMSQKASGGWQRKTQATPPQGSCWASWQHDSGPDPGTCGQRRTFPTGAGLHFLPRADSWQDFRTSGMPAKRKEELSWPCRGGKPSGRQPGALPACLGPATLPRRPGRLGTAREHPVGLAPVTGDCSRSAQVPWGAAWCRDGVLQST